MKANASDAGQRMGLAFAEDEPADALFVSPAQWVRPRLPTQAGIGLTARRCSKIARCSPASSLGDDDWSSARARNGALWASEVGAVDGPARDDCCASMRVKAGSVMGLKVLILEEGLLCARS